MPFPQALSALQFAKYMEVIQYLYATNEDFKSLCDDYATSKKNMENLVGQSLDYQQLSMELEKDILDYLKKINEK